MLGQIMHLERGRAIAPLATPLTAVSGAPGIAYRVRMVEDGAIEVDGLDAWLAEGRMLAQQRRDAEWATADWMAQGKQAGHLDRVRFSLLSERLGITTRKLKDALKAALTFPLEQRQACLSVDHHALIANLPDAEASALLQRAIAERLSIQAAREAVAQHRLATGERFSDDDTDSSLATVQIRAWNRATPEARALAFEHFRISAAKGHGIIDEDEAVDG